MHFDVPGLQGTHETTNAYLQGTHAFVLAHGARKPCSVAIVDLVDMTLQITICFKHGSAHVARKLFCVDIVDLGKMPSQGAMMFAFELALVARKPFSVDVVLVGKMLF